MRARDAAAALCLGAIAVAMPALAPRVADALSDAADDAYHQLSGVRCTPDSVALVLLDDATFAAMRDRPLAFWQPQLGTALDVLADVKAKAIGIDLVFSSSAEDIIERLAPPAAPLFRDYEAGFLKALSRPESPVVLATHLAVSEDGTVSLVLPPDAQVAALPDAPQALGAVNLESDADGTVRHFTSGYGSDATRYPTFAWLLARRAADPSAFARAGRIAYCGPPGTVASVSLQRLLRAGAASDPVVQALRGKIAIITSAASSGLNDLHPSPYTHGFPGTVSRLMSGGEIQANVVNTLLTGPRREVPRGILVVIAFLVCAALSWQLIARSRAVAVALAGGAMAAVLAIGFWLHLRGWYAGLGGIILAIPGACALSGAWSLRAESQARRRTRRLFGRYVSDRVVDALLAGSLPELGGEEREVTVLFCDIRGFTTFSEALPPKAVVDILNLHFETMCAAILAQEGIVDKFIGDAVMAVFGSPLHQDDHAARALRAALAMRDASEALRERIAAYLPAGMHYRIGIGVHSGAALVGTIGSQRRKEFTAIGDTVNVASRLEGLTKELGAAILVSAEAVKAAGRKFVFGPGRRVAIRGRAEDLEAYELLEERTP